MTERRPGGDDEAVKPPAVDPILVVDDDPVTRLLIAASLSASGLEVVEAGTGEQALALLAMGGYRAVVLDNHLPGLTGLMLLRRIRENPHTATIPVLLVTGDDAVTDRVTGLRSGASDYITKPFDSEELVARVEAQLRHQEAWTSILDAHRRQRHALTAALTSLRSNAELEDAAVLLCHQVHQLGYPSVAILAFVGSTAVPLAVAGNPAWSVVPDRALPAPVTRYLLDKSNHGPWLEHLETDGLATYPQGPLPGPAVLALAPIIAGDHCAGLLVLEAPDTGSSSGHWEASRTLSETIDFADIAAGFLQPGLDRRRSDAGEQYAVAETLARRAFSPVFQPIVELDDRRVVGYEALTRFADGAPPDVHFAHATAVGLGVELELAAIEAALNAARRLPPDAFVTLNASPATAAAPQLNRSLAKTDRATVIELTEHDRVEDYPALRRALNALTDTRLSIDDAGAGFSTLRHVLELRPDFLKLDRTWVTDIDADLTRQALVSGILHFGRETGCRVIAEGVERQAEADTLRGLGVRLGQGFLFARPQPV